MEWAWQADLDVRRTRRWEWTVVCYDRRAAPGTYFMSGVRSKVARALCKTAGPSLAPRAVVARAFSRVHTELVGAAGAEPADLYYGGTTGGIVPAAQAAALRGAPYALDLEDFYSSEVDGPTSELIHRLAELLERAILPGASFLTAGSAPIADAYAEKYGVRPVPINNTFRLPAFAPDLTPSPGEGLRLYWFSQTVGPNRGLEEAVRAMGLAGVPGELHLRGRPSGDYLARLCGHVASTAKNLRIVHHEPAPPDKMVEVSSGYDVGLALEQPHIPNRDLCLTNKAFTYMLAGLAVAMTDTRGQRPLALDMGEGAALYQPGDVYALAERFRFWARDKSRLAAAKAAAWEAARRRWHWEHPLEKGALLRLVESAVVHSDSRQPENTCVAS